MPASPAATSPPSSRWRAGDYPNVIVEVQPTPILTAPEPLDMVWTSQNYHDYPDEFMGRVDPAALNRAVFAMLKPGGTWFVIDHAAAPGAGLRDTERLHRIDPELVRRQVEEAGFEYVGASDVLRNPATATPSPSSTRRSGAAPISSSCASASRPDALAPYSGVSLPRIARTPCR